MNTNQNFENNGIYLQNQRRFPSFKRRKLSEQVKIVGNYRIGAKLGQGGNGHVYVAYKLNKDCFNKFAVKILPKTQENLLMLKNQIKILQSLNHDNIVKFQQVIYENNRVFIFMELCSKGDLFNFIKSNGQLNEQLAADIFIKIYSAVLYLHENGITHRDIKAENILFDQKMNPKLSDFGFARFYNNTESLLDTWCGTFNYVAPQIIKKRKYKPELIDLWSLTVVLYVLLTCKQPFQRQNNQKISLQNYIVSFTWEQNSILSKQAIQFFSCVFVPSQHRISLLQVKNTAFYKKYAPIDSPPNNQNKILQPQPNITFAQPTLIQTDISKFYQFKSQNIQIGYKPRNRIQLMRTLRKQSEAQIIEPIDKLKIRKSSKQTYSSKNKQFQQN